MVDQNHDVYRGSRWWSKSILTGSIVAVALLPVGALGSRLGLWEFATGFMLLGAGAMLASIGLVTGIAGIVAARRRRLAPDKPPLYVGTALSALVLALLGLQFTAAFSVPQIHNISTDVTDPPRFDAVTRLRDADDNPLEYDAAEIAPAQQQAYPWVETLRTDLAPDAALDRAVTVLQGMGIEVVNVDEQDGIAEGTATTFWFGFKDDVVVRVRPAANGAFVDMRSVSRVGQSDLGKNAERIGEFLDTYRTGA